MSALYVPHTPGRHRRDARGDRRGARSTTCSRTSRPACARAPRSTCRTGSASPTLRARLAALAARNARRHDAVFLGAGAYPHFIPAVVDHVLLRPSSRPPTRRTSPRSARARCRRSSSSRRFSRDAARPRGRQRQHVRRRVGDRRGGADGAPAAARTAGSCARRARAAPAVSRGRPHLPAGARRPRVREVPFGADGRIDRAALARRARRRHRVRRRRLPELLRRDRGPGRDGATTCSAAGALAGHRHRGSARARRCCARPGARRRHRRRRRAELRLAAVVRRARRRPLRDARAHVRAMPGRLVGETVDENGRRGFVLTLATREQHIRRERATSNICTNQGLCALAATVYLALLGRRGLRALARVELRARPTTWPRGSRQAARRSAFGGPFFNEFVVRSPDAAARWQRAGARARAWWRAFRSARGIPELEDALLVCATEVHAAGRRSIAWWRR